MKELLAKAIGNTNPEIMQLFAVPFDRPNKWIDYLRLHFGPSDALTTSKILNMADRWDPVRFQALYIACWIYHPLEKGSFMIQLNDQQTANAEASAGKLTWRKSSHLSTTSRSARGGRDFQFINGYGELLVIVEGNFLFLKMEGHAASSPSHLKSWITKLRTGAGETANKHLNALSRDSKWGIEQRAAENYSKTYKALIKTLGFKGKTVTFHQVIQKLHTVIPTVTIQPNDNAEAALRDYLKRLYAMANDNSIVRGSTVFAPLMAARSDMDEVVTAIVRDDQRMDGVDNVGLDRVFREVRVTPTAIDGELRKFLKTVQNLSAPVSVPL